MKFFIVTFLVLLAYASANEDQNSAIENQEQHEIEKSYPEQLGRLFLNGLNSTTLVVGVAILAGLLLFALFAANSPGASAYNRYDQDQAYADYYNHQGGYYSEDPQYQTRYKRFTHDIASKMAQLEQAFKKYQVEEAECELYIACEASQEQRIEENGPLARIVFDILSTFNRAKDGHKWDDRMEGLVKAFEFGTGASASGQVDPCQPLRNKCFELHAKY